MIIEKYKKELYDMILKLKSIKELEIDSVNIYGSAVNEKMFVEGISDIDVIVLCRDFPSFNKEKIISDLNNMTINFAEKRPIIIKDSLCERIEFYISYNRINIDITICPGLVPTRESLERDAWYDGFEALMGGVYIGSKCIYGQIPDYDDFVDNYYPFYDDELREKRLTILANRLDSYNERIRGYVENNSPELVDHLFKVKKYFIKFLYIYNKTYYWTPEKHTYYQLTKFLNLPENEKRKLCFMSGDLKNCALEYLELSDEYLKAYKNQNRDASKRLIR